MADQRTMAELLRAPTEGYVEAIVVPLILAEKFELKYSLINMMTSDQFFRLEKDNPHDHIRCQLTHTVNQQTSNVTTAMTAILKQFQATPPPTSVKAVEEICVTCGGAHPYYQCLAASGNTFLELRDNTQGYVSAAAVNYNQGSFADFVIVDYESDPRVLFIWGRPFLQTAHALIDVHREKMILRDGDERLTLNMRHDTSSYSNQPQKESTNMINIFNNSSEDFLENLFATNHQSGNPTFSSHPELTSPKVKDAILDLEGGDVLVEKVINLDSTKDLPPHHNVNPLSGSTTSLSSPNHLLEEFADELALITYPPGNDDLPFDIGFDLKEIEYLLNNDPIKEIDPILEDSIDEDNLTDLNGNLADTIPEMFTDEHALDYSFPSLYDKYDNDLFEVESDTEYVYDDPFDSKGEKIKESKLLIDELDLPRSSDFLPSPEYDSFLFEDFSKVDALPLTDNEDKVFNSGILIQENIFEVNTHVAPDKNVKKIAISHASLILEDFDPPLYELPFLKEVLVWGNWVKLSDLTQALRESGNPTFSSHPELTSPKVKDAILDPEGGDVLVEKVINIDSTKDLPPHHNVNPLSGSTTSSSSPNHLLEEFADELALITYPPGNDDLPFDIGFDLKEIEYFLNNDLIKEIDSILEDSIDEDNLTDLNGNLADTIPEMFTDEHALDYSFPPLYDKYDNDLFEVESDIEYVYDDPFDSKGEKIKESKLLIDELDLPKNISEVNTHVAPDKNVKKIAISHASLILEDFDPPLYELPFLKEVPGSETILSFSFKNMEKFLNPGF
nr:hypothetical protein [Tanacetum cinerariifolium]